jgi:hypothetical protein
MSRRSTTALIAAVLTLGVVGVGCGADREGTRVGQAENIAAGEEATYEYLVPFGSGNRLDSGEILDIMPQELTVRVGESIRIVNDDIRDFMIGPFFVMAGQTLAMRFTNPGTIEGVCEINPEGKFVITVLE